MTSVVFLFIVCGLYFCLLLLLIEHQDDGEKLEDSLIRKASSSLKEKEASQPEASSADRHLGSSEEDSPTSDEFDRML